MRVQKPKRGPVLNEEQEAFVREMFEEGSPLNEIREALEPSAPGVTLLAVARVVGLADRHGTIKTHTRAPWNPNAPRVPAASIIDRMRRED